MQKNQRSETVRCVPFTSIPHHEEFVETFDCVSYGGNESLVLVDPAVLVEELSERQKTDLTSDFTMLILELNAIRESGFLVGLGGEQPPAPKETITLSKFYMDALISARQTGWRLGQATFNLLADVRPDLSEQVRGTDMDIFYLTGPAEDFEKWDRFARFIEQGWY